MRALLVLGSAAFLTACVSGDGGVAKIKAAKDASGLMLTDASAASVAQCMAGRLRSQAQSNSGGYLVQSGYEPDLSYRVTSINDPLKRFTTRVDIVGQPIQSRDLYVAACLHPDAIDRSTVDVSTS